MHPVTFIQGYIYRQLICFSLYFFIGGGGVQTHCQILCHSHRASSRQHQPHGKLLRAQAVRGPRPRVQPAVRDSQQDDAAHARDSPHFLRHEHEHGYEYFLQVHELEGNCFYYLFY